MRNPLAATWRLIQFSATLWNVVRLHRRGLERRLALLDAAEHLARLLTRLLDREHVGAAERGPNLFAVGIAGDSDVDGGPLRWNADVMAALLGVGHRVALALARQRRHHLVGQDLAPLSAHRLIHGKTPSG